MSSNTWPWEDLLKGELINHVLLEIVEGYPFDSREPVPRNIVSMVKAIHEASLSDKWLKVFSACSESRESLPQLLLSTRKVLLDSGYRSDLSGAMVGCLAASGMQSLLDDDFGFASPAETLCVEVAEAVLSGLLGKPNLRLVASLLEDARHCGAQQTSEFEKALKALKAGDCDAARHLIPRVCRFWHMLVARGELREWGPNELLGPVFECALKFSSDPEGLSIRAHVKYIFGRAGDEDEAVALAAQAAFSGSRTGWLLLNEWRNSGDSDRVLHALLSQGSRKFSGADCCVEGEGW